MGMDGEKGIFFWIHNQLAVLSVPAGYTQQKDNPGDLLIWVDVTVTEQSFGHC